MAKKTFEQSLSALEKIVDELESGDLPLEKALKKFDEGMALSRQCSRMLDETEKKVTQLVGETTESTIESPFEINPNPES
ncbi:MAG: exodeoxyribonuclease VII small subunit [Desulfobacteraceae bacterium]|nr:exodeoxyribonuclease VII small subunit [Desulfobacteraceae bacterium]MBC2752721.1 exodeoxyribonuclease VII small subunit [Desulfobacteraceae bacterium]